MKEQYVVGLDLGGTNIKAVLVDQKGQILSRILIPAESSKGPEHVIQRMLQAAGSVSEQANIEIGEVLGVGVGSPGPLDPENGIIINAANLPGWINVHLRDQIKKLIGKTAIVMNDASAAAYGEYWQGAGNDAQSICLLTLGTGIGGGVVFNGHVLQGAFGNGAEIGHMILYPEGRQCSCGQKGCLEAYASSSHMIPDVISQIQKGRGGELKRRYERNDMINTQDIVEAALQGDELAREVWDQACTAIALACINLKHVFEPECILLGGGMSAAGEVLLQPVYSYFQDGLWRLAPNKTEIRLAALGNDAGAVGAAGWFLHQHGYADGRSG